MSGMLDNRYVRGAVVVLGGVLVMSFDAALIRAVDQPAGVLSLWRGVLICAAMVLAAGVCHVAGVKQRWDNEWAAWGNGLLFGMVSVAFFDRSRMITLFVYMCDIVGDPVPRSEIEAVEWVPVTCSPGDGSTFQSRVIPDIARMRGQC